MRPFHISRLRHTRHFARSATFHASRCYGRHPYHTYTETTANAQQPEIRMRRPLLSRRRFGSFVVYTFAVFIGVQWFMRKFDVEITEEEIEEEDEDYSWFIPLQYPGELPEQFYKETDPEWVEFVKFSRDKSRQKQMHSELAQHVATDMNRHQDLKKNLGSPLTATRWWLDIRYPDSPPPEYARKGIQWGGDGGVTIKEEIIPHSQYVHLHHILWPRAIFAALTKSLHVLYRLQILRFKKALGVSLNDMDKSIHKLAALNQMQQRMAAMQREKDLENEPSQPPPPPPQSSRPRPPPPAHPLPGTPAGAPLSHPDGARQPGVPLEKDSQPSDSDDGKWSIPLVVVVPSIPSELALSMIVFRTSLMQNLEVTSADFNPKGCFFVFGQVEVQGNRGRCKVDVKSAYDPRVGKFVFIHSQIKHVWLLKQRPRG